MKSTQKQTFIVGIDKTETPPKITANIFPNQVEVVLTESKLRTLEMLNDQGIIFLVKSWIEEKQLEFNF